MATADKLGIDQSPMRLHQGHVSAVAVDIHGLDINEPFAQERGGLLFGRKPTVLTIFWAINAVEPNRLDGAPMTNPKRISIKDPDHNRLVGTKRRTPAKKEDKTDIDDQTDISYHFLYTQFKN